VGVADGDGDGRPAPGVTSDSDSAAPPANAAAPCLADTDTPVSVPDPLPPNVTFQVTCVPAAFENVDDVLASVTELAVPDTPAVIVQVSPFVEFVVYVAANTSPAYTTTLPATVHPVIESLPFTGNVHDPL
jgi:hypothetical protein